MLGGVGFFWLVAVANMISSLRAGHTLEKHLRARHYQQWRHIYWDDRWKKALMWPFMRDTPVDFLWKSNETFGDGRIGDLRARVKRGFYGFLLAGVAGMAWFAIVALWLESRR